MIKPSNLINGMAAAMLTVRPNAHALLLHAPLRVYLGSIAKKGMWGRLWVRDLLVKQRHDGLHDFGWTSDDYLGQTDLQAGAAGWLAQHALFHRLAAKFPGRVRTLDSDALMAAPETAMAALGAQFGLKLDAAAVVAGPAFTRHSKFGTDFDRGAREGEHRDAAAVHADEIDKVATWAEAVAERFGIAPTLPVPLI